MARRVARDDAGSAADRGAPDRIPTPVEVYVFLSPGCGHCEKTKAEVVPAVREAGAFVVELEARFTEPEMCGVKPTAYPTWLFSRLGQKQAVIVGYRPAKEILKTWRKLRGE